MSGLKQALMISQEITSSEADDLIEEMKERILEQGENPEDVLSDYGLETDYVFDLI